MYIYIYIWIYIYKYIYIYMRPVGRSVGRSVGRVGQQVRGWGHMQWGRQLLCISYYSYLYAYVWYLYKYTYIYIYIETCVLLITLICFLGILSLLLEQNSMMSSGTGWREGRFFLFCCSLFCSLVRPGSSKLRHRRRFCVRSIRIP